MILDYRKYITDTESKGIVNFVTSDENIELFTHDTICPFCKEKIDNQVYYNHKEDYPDWLCGSFSQSENVIQCQICGWWEYRYWNQSDAIVDGIRAKDIRYSSVIIKKYDDDSIEVPVSVLRTYIEKKQRLYIILIHIKWKSWLDLFLKIFILRAKSNHLVKQVMGVKMYFNR